MRLQLRSFTGEQRRSRVPRCQAGRCSEIAVQVVEIELPAAWEASDRYTVMTVYVGACGEHGPELERRALALLDARADIKNLLQILESAVGIEKDLRTRLETAVADCPGGDVGAVIATRPCWPRAGTALRAIDDCEHRWADVDGGHRQCTASCRVVLEGSLATSPPERGMDWDRAVLVVRAFAGVRP